MLIKNCNIVAQYPGIMVTKNTLRFLIFAVLTLNAAGIFGQDTLRLLIVSTYVGGEIDSTEKSIYHLFPYHSNNEFLSARFFQKKDSSIFLQTQLKNGSKKNISYTSVDFHNLKQRIDSEGDNLDRQRLNNLKKEAERKKSLEEKKRQIENEKRINEDNKSKRPAKNIVYAELMGSLFPYSLNYERVLNKKWSRTNFSLRFGISYFKIDAYDYNIRSQRSASFVEGTVTSPFYFLFKVRYPSRDKPSGTFQLMPLLISLNLIKGEGNHHMELDLGYRYNFISNQTHDLNNYYYSQMGMLPVNYQSYGNATGLIAYRYQKPWSSFFFRTGLSLVSQKYKEHDLDSPLFLVPVFSMGGAF